MIPIFDSINLTKLDVLDKFKEIYIGVGYENDGKMLDDFPGNLYQFNIH